MPEGQDTTTEVSNIMSFVLYTQILKQSFLKPASPGITLIHINARYVIQSLHYLLDICIAIYTWPPHRISVVTSLKLDLYDKTTYK